MSCSFDPILRKHTVYYEGDPNLYEEDLITGAFQIWDDHGAVAHHTVPIAASEVMVWLQLCVSVACVYSYFFF